MKNLVVKQEERKPEFLPIHISFTIENERELRELWHRFNVNITSVYHISDMGIFPIGSDQKSSFSKLWSFLDDFAHKNCGKNSQDSF